MNTILTNDEIDAAWDGLTPSGYGKSRYDIARAVIAAYEAKLAQQEPVASVRTWHKNGDQHAELDDWGLGLASIPDGTHNLYAHPAPQQADRQQIYDAATHASAMAVFMTRMDAEQPDADDKGVSGWLQDAEDRIRSRASQPLEKLISQADRQRVPAEDSPAVCDAYERIDRFLRNNLGDEDYADYSHDLDLLAVAPEAPAQAEQTKCVPCPTCGANTASTNPANWCACPKTPAQASAVDERAAFEAWLGIKPCGAAHEFGWDAWQARAALAQKGGK